MRLALIAALCLSGCTAQAEPAAQNDPLPVCETYRFETVPHIVCRVPDSARVQLYLGEPNGEPIQALDGLDERLAPGETLRMAMNAGMYHADRSPVGLYIEGGETVAPLVTREGPGNFGMLPNGVFWSDGERWSVTESRAFDALDAEPVQATQSGPMLVIDGALHPRFLPDSESAKRRNGVGVTQDGDVVFAISDAPVTFHHFARLFRDALGTPNALFLDGSISRIHAPELDRSERGAPLGPVVAIVAVTPEG